MTAYHIHIANQEKSIFNFGETVCSTDSSGTIESKVVFKEKTLEGWYNEIVFDGFKIGYGEYSVQEDCDVQFTFSGETIEMIFVLKGSFAIEIPSVKKVYYFNAQEQNIMFYNTTEGMFKLGKRKEMKVISFSLSPHFFRQFLPDDTDFDEFKKLIRKSKQGILKHNNYRITNKINSLLNEIFTAEWQGHYRKMYINARVLEVLMLQLDLFKNNNDFEVQKALEGGNEDKIIQAREYILQHFKKPLTLQFLSKKVGTNEFALKKGFKAMFGTTVFSYITDLKMQKAKELLVSKHLPISQVSEIVGYKNPQHFSTAFKRKFGVTPGKLKG